MRRRATTTSSADDDDDIRHDHHDQHHNRHENNHCDLAARADRQPRRQHQRAVRKLDHLRRVAVWQLLLRVLLVRQRRRILRRGMQGLVRRVRGRLRAAAAAWAEHVYLDRAVLEHQHQHQHEHHRATAIQRQHQREVWCRRGQIYLVSLLS